MLSSKSDYFSICCMIIFSFSFKELVQCILTCICKVANSVPASSILYTTFLNSSLFSFLSLCLRFCNLIETFFIAPTVGRYIHCSVTIFKNSLCSTQLINPVHIQQNLLSQQTVLDAPLSLSLASSKALKSPHIS